MKRSQNTVVRIGKYHFLALLLDAIHILFMSTHRPKYNTYLYIFYWCLELRPAVSLLRLLFGIICLSGMTLYAWRSCSFWRIVRAACQSCFKTKCPVVRPFGTSRHPFLFFPWLLLSPSFLDGPWSQWCSPPLTPPPPWIFIVFLSYFIVFLSYFYHIFIEFLSRMGFNTPSRSYPTFIGCCLLALLRFPRTK